MQLKVILDLKLFKFLFWSFKTVLTAEGIKFLTCLRGKMKQMIYTTFVASGKNLLLALNNPELA